MHDSCYFVPLLYNTVSQFVATTFVLMFLAAFKKVGMKRSCAVYSLTCWLDGAPPLFLLLFFFSSASLLMQVELPSLDLPLFRSIFPISLFYFGNVLAGLGGTASLNLPMFTVLRRFSIAMTMVGGWVTDLHVTCIMITPLAYCYLLSVVTFACHMSLFIFKNFDRLHSF